MLCCVFLCDVRCRACTVSLFRRKCSNLENGGDAFCPNAACGKPRRRIQESSLFGTPKSRKPTTRCHLLFNVVLRGSTCFGQYYAHHQELRSNVRAVGYSMCYSQQPGHYSSLPAPNFQHTANQERNDQCGNQKYSREFMMMRMVLPETC